MPGLSDPGYRLVTSCIEADIPVEVVPGPTASVTALVLSGLPPARFVFEGFLPRRAGDRRRRIAELASETRTLVIYESPHRIAAAVQDLLTGFGDRPAALVRELTKMHEEVRRGSLAELVAGVEDDPPRGEIVLVVSGAVHEHRIEPAASELARRARALMDEGVERKDALAQTAREAGVPRRKVFDALLEGSAGPNE
jgi:16S rRNA (cytidine1402-2'-O)-methyltransferase